MRKTRIALDPTESDEATGAVTEIGIFVDREDEPAPELREQLLLLSPEELQYLYHRMQDHYERGTWTEGTVEW